MGTVLGTEGFKACGIKYRVAADAAALRFPVHRCDTYLTNNTHTPLSFCVLHGGDINTLLCDSVFGIKTRRMCFYGKDVKPV
jgi:hypothetical protein